MEADSGKLLVQLFASKKDWQHEKSTRNETLSIQDGESLWLLNNLPSGKYAIRCFHDKNENGKLDTNFLGIPKEPYGFSNNVRGKIGPPSWKASTFLLDTELLTIDIHLK